MDSSYNPFEEKKKSENNYTPPPKVKTENWEQLFENIPAPQSNTTSEILEKSWIKTQKKPTKRFFN